MKVKELTFKGIACAVTLALFSSCATLNTAQQPFPDDVYGRNAEVSVIAKNNNNQNYTQENYQSDYNDGYYDGLSYANRISRFYYGTPGLPYYDPWVSNWDLYSPFGPSFYFGVGFGNSWYNPYYGYSSFGWGYPYYGNYWGPYSYYGNYQNIGIRDRRTRPSGLGTDNVRPGSSVITRPSTARTTRGTTARTSDNDRLQRTRSTITGAARPTSIERTRGNTNTRSARPSSTQRPTETIQRERPTQARPAPSSRPTYTPRSSSPAPRSSAPTRSSSGGSRSRR